MNNRQHGVAVFVPLLLLTGCHAPIRFGIGPTVDSARQPGVIAFVSAGGGPSYGPVQAGIVATVGAGSTDGAKTPMVLARAEPFVGPIIGGFAYLRFAGLLGLRSFFFPEGSQVVFAGGLSAAALFRIFGEPIKGFSGGPIGFLGPEIQFEYAGFQDSSRLFFSFPLVMELDVNAAGMFK